MRNMRSFFASLRSMLAYVDLEKMNLGSIVHDLIQDEFIPRLRKRLRTVKTDNDKERIQSLISEYEKYSDPKTQESKIFGKMAANNVRNLSQRARLSDEEMEDLTQNLAVDFFLSLEKQEVLRKKRQDEVVPKRQKGKPQGKNLKEVMLGFDEMGGPLALNNLWGHVTTLRTQYRIREVQRLYKEKVFEMEKGEEGEERDPISQVPAPSMVDESYVRQVMSDMISSIHKKVKDPEMSGMFDLWLDVAQDKGANRVDMKNDVYKVLEDKGYDASPRTMERWWLELKRMIVDFFDKELEGDVSFQVRKLLHVSSAEVVAYVEFRRRFAAWMLRI